MPHKKAHGGLHGRGYDDRGKHDEYDVDEVPQKRDEQHKKDGGHDAPAADVDAKVPRGHSAIVAHDSKLQNTSSKSQTNSNFQNLKFGAYLWFVIWILELISGTRSLLATRLCSPESLSRTVTVSSSNVLKSMVMHHGVPISSCLR